MSMPEEHMNIYKAARRESGYTQEAAAEVIAVSGESIRAYENGYRTPPNDIVERMAHYYHAPQLIYQHLQDKLPDPADRSPPPRSEHTGDGSPDVSPPYSIQPGTQRRPPDGHGRGRPDRRQGAAGVRGHYGRSARNHTVWIRIRRIRLIPTKPRTAVRGQRVLYTRIPSPF